jgi:methyltransferase (TIGR00027 family)
MNPVSDTAYLTCGARADDAMTTTPICGDQYAGLFLGEHGKKVYSTFKKERNPLAGIVARHRIMDDLLRQKIEQDKRTSIIIIGAGFDTRAFRLDAGNWAEIDEPQVIEVKNQVLPAAQCKNPLQRIAIDFSQERLADKLPAIAPEHPVVVVMEGVCIYLSEQQIHQTLALLQAAYPGHTLICDINSRRFMTRYGKSLRQRIEALGATLKYLVDDTSKIFVDNGYRLESTTSVVANTFEFANAKLLRFVIPVLMPELIKGYVVYTLHARNSRHSA